MLKITEIFYSIQGESSWVGYPCVFVRLSECNLHCTWCDTYDVFRPSREMSIAEVMARIALYPSRLVEITGGEPLLQHESIDLMKKLLKAGYQVLLETNGSLSIKDVPRKVIKVLDVKCPGSGESQRNLFENFPYLESTDDIKFVVKDRIDFDYAMTVIRQHRLENRAGLLISPAWGEVALTDLARWVLSSGIEIRLQVQLHKIIWGPNAGGV